MTIQSIGPPPLTKDGDSLLDRWLQLFWQNSASISPISGDSILANKMFFSHSPAPTQANALVGDSQLQIGMRTLLPHQPPFYATFNAVDSASILAGQIFGR